MTTHIVLMGAPGSGKGTFSEYLTKNDKYYHLCLGDILRKEMNDKTPIGLECKSFVDAGKLVPTSTGIKIFEQHYDKAAQQNKFVIVDGMVQNEDYANYFKQFFTGKKVAYVYLNTPKEQCIERLQTRKICTKCAKVYSFQATDCCDTLLQKRTDDSNIEAVARRVDRFNTSGIKLVDFYKDSNLIEFDATHSIHDLIKEYRALFIQKVSAVGYAVVDRVIRVGQVSHKKGEGHVVSWDDFSKLPNGPLKGGGSSANVMKGVSMLGLNASFGGKTGPDDEGIFYKERLVSQDVTPYLARSDNPTAQVTCLVTPDAERTMMIFLGAGAEYTDKDLAEDLFNGISLFHLDGYSLWNGSLFEASIQRAKEKRALVSFDLGLESIAKSNKERILSILNHVDVLFGNEEEIAALTENPALLPCSVVVVKMGARGAFILSKGRSFQSPAIAPKEVKDTIGAGDGFAAGFLYGYLTGRSLEESTGIGNLVASRVVETEGAELPLETWTEIKTRISS